MTHDTIYHRWGPSYTPPIVRWLIIISCTLSLFSALTHHLFVQFLNVQTPFSFFSLSWRGLREYHLWQLVTYSLIQEGAGIDIWYLFNLLFHMYILWIIGTMVQERTGTNHFIGLCLFSSIVAGVATLLVMPMFDHYILIAGPGAVLLALLAVWAAYYPENPLFFLFLFPLKPKWLLSSVLGILVFSSLSKLDFLSIVFYLSGALSGYLYGLLVLGLYSPYEFSHPFDRWLLHLRNRLLGIKDSSAKVVDISSGSSFEEDAFVDAMLTKISKHGEHALTPAERQRMEQISQRRRKTRR